MLTFNQVPIIGPYIPIILSAIFGYSGLKLMARKGPEMYNNYVQQWGGDGTKKQVVLKCSPPINQIKLLVRLNY